MIFESNILEHGRAAGLDAVASTGAAGSEDPKGAAGFEGAAGKDDVPSNLGRMFLMNQVSKTSSFFESFPFALLNAATSPPSVSKWSFKRAIVNPSTKRHCSSGRADRQPFAYPVLIKWYPSQI